MESNKNNLKANLLRDIARYGLLITIILVGAFALVSGSESYGDGLQGIVKNSMNSLPWLILLLCLVLAWKKELAGGVLITTLGIILVIFFNTGVNFFLATFILTMIIPVFGLLFIGSWFLRRMEL